MTRGKSHLFDYKYKFKAVLKYFCNRHFENVAFTVIVLENTSVLA